MNLFCQYVVSIRQSFFVFFFVFNFFVLYFSTYTHVRSVRRSTLFKVKKMMMERIRETVLFSRLPSSTMSLFLITFYKCNSHLLLLLPPFGFFSPHLSWAILLVFFQRGAHSHMLSRRKTISIRLLTLRFQTASSSYFSLEI